MAKKAAATPKAKVKTIRITQLRSTIGFDTLLDRRRHFLGLADAVADHAVAVADDDQRAEAQVLAALDDLRHAADVDDRVLQFQPGRVNLLARFRHNTSFALFTFSRGPAPARYQNSKPALRAASATARMRP